MELVLLDVLRGRWPRELQLGMAETPHESGLIAISAREAPMLL